MLNTSACRMNGMSRVDPEEFHGACSCPGEIAFGCRPSRRLRRPAARPGRSRRSSSFLRPPYIRVDQAAREQHRREHRGQDAEAVHHGEAAHRPGAEREQRDAGDQRGDVGVEDRAPGALVAGVDRRLRRGAAAQLLADALVDQHVGVDRHAERQRDGGDAGQRQRGLQHRQHRHQQQQVDRQRDRRDHAEQQVVDAHEQRDRDEAVDHASGSPSRCSPRPGSGRWCAPR